MLLYHDAWLASHNVLHSRRVPLMDVSEGGMVGWVGEAALPAAAVAIARRSYAVCLTWQKSNKRPILCQGSRERRKERDVTVVMDGVRVGNVVVPEERIAPKVTAWEFHAEDVARAGDFYREVFAWRLAPVQNGLWGGVATCQQVGLDAAVSIVSGQPLTFPYVEVADLEATLARVERLGGRTILPPWQAEDATRLALFTDPEGNRVGLIQRRR